MDNTTKIRILDEALIMFAENGYKGTNLRDLAAQLGLSKSALYKHYASKEEIWKALLDRMEAYYAERFGSENHLPDIPNSCEELFTVTMGMIDFTVNDSRIILTRKLLLTEQFHDERVCKLATKHFLGGTEKIFAVIFENMMAGGLLKKEDSEMLAFVYTAPITSLIHLCDREPHKKPEAMEQMKKCIRHFIKTYGVEV